MLQAWAPNGQTSSGRWHDPGLSCLRQNVSVPTSWHSVLLVSGEGVCARLQGKIMGLASVRLHWHLSLGFFRVVKPVQATLLANTLTLIYESTNAYATEVLVAEPA